LGLSGRIPRRVDAATKAGLLDLVDHAAAAGWTVAAVCRLLELGELRVWRWLGRRAAGRLDDLAPGGSPMHGLLAAEVDEIVALFHEWGETDRSHRKLAHRGSYLNRLWVSPSSVRRVLEEQGLRLRPLPRPGHSTRKPFPDWVDYVPNQIWIYDTTQFPRAGMAALAFEDLVSRKWLTTVVSVEETSTQVQLAFTEALIAEGLIDKVTARQDGLVDPTVDDPHRPILLAVSDNGAQMTSGSTREFMAWSAPQMLVEEVFDDGHDLAGGPLLGLAAGQRQLAVSGSGQQVAGAVGAGGDQRLVQQFGLGGGDDAVVVAVQQQERWGGRMGEVGGVGAHGAVAVDRVAGVGDHVVHARVESVGDVGQVRGAELVDDRPDAWVGQAGQGGEVTTGGLTPHG